MHPVRIAGATTDAAAPKDWDVEKDGPCGTLSIKTERIVGLAFMTSAWQPTPEELEHLVKGGSVRLSISAPQHPVVQVGVIPPVPEIAPMTYCKVKETPGWDKLLVWDEDKDCQSELSVVEINTVEGWVLVYQTDEKGNYIPDGDELLTEKVKGNFTLRWS